VDLPGRALLNRKLDMGQSRRRTALYSTRTNHYKKNEDNTMDNAILTPALALISWTMLVWAWMYALRIPAMNAAAIDPDNARHPGSLDVLPGNVRSVADNYNHLHEQPTVFYALVFYTLLAGNGDGTNITLAWVYVSLRVVHSLVQNTVNKVMIRFGVFALSSLVLVALTVRNLLAL
jgi:hypothetical protein